MSAVMVREPLAADPKCERVRRVAERGLLMSGPMVRATLDGTKTQTRRVIIPQPAFGLGYQMVNGKARPVGPDYPDGEDEAIRCPYGQPGDRLWVRESYRFYHESDWLDGGWCSEQSIPGSPPNKAGPDGPNGYIVGPADRRGFAYMYRRKGGTKAQGRTLDGRTWDEFPAREVPDVQAKGDAA